MTNTHFANVLAILAGTETDVDVTLTNGDTHSGRISDETTTDVAVVLLDTWETTADRLTGEPTDPSKVRRAHIRIDHIAAVAERPRSNALFGRYEEKATDSVF